MCKIEKEQLTITTALNFARHDFLNKLQIILMHIDLDGVQDAKKVILNVTDEMRQLSRLELLGLPKTAEWLLTFGWVYPAYQKTLTCSNKSGARTANDAEVAIYLEQVFHGVEQLLNPAFEYEALIDVSSTSTNWSIKITVIGALLKPHPALENGTSFVVDETISHNLWTFTLSGQ